jgi:CO/xanthine dehydrogenase FAD-binding subunit
MTTMQYERPSTTATILDRLTQQDHSVALLAGGTDLLPNIRSRLIRPTLVVDIKGVKQLHRLDRGSDGLSIGAAVILNRLLEQETTTSGYSALVQAVSQLASGTIRNRATLVGNVSNASPCADTVPPLCAMGGQVEILGSQGTRKIPVVEFITGNRQTRLQPGEMVTRVVVPEPSTGSWSGFCKRKRVKGHDLALASAALLRDPEKRQLRLSIGSCNPTPVLIELDDMFDEPDAAEAIRRTQDHIRPIDDVRASIEYRRDMVAVMVRRLLSDMDHAAG